MSRLGGMGSSSYNIFVPESLRSRDRTIADIVQTMRQNAAQTHNTMERSKDRKAQEKAQKRAHKQQNKMFGKNLAANLALDFAPMAVGAVAGSVPMDVGDAGNMPIESAGDVASSPAMGMDAASAGRIADQAIAAPSMAESKFAISQGMDAMAGLPDRYPQITSAMNNPASVGMPTGIPTNMPSMPAPTKYAFGNNLGSSMARGALGGLMSRFAPGLLAGNPAFNPMLSQKMALANAQFGLDVARNNSLNALTNAQTGRIGAMLPHEIESERQRAYASQMAGNRSATDARRLASLVGPQVDAENALAQERLSGAAYDQARISRMESLLPGEMDVLGARATNLYSGADRNTAAADRTRQMAPLQMNTERAREQSYLSSALDRAMGGGSGTNAASAFGLPKDVNPSQTMQSEYLLSRHLSGLDPNSDDYLYDYVGTLGQAAMEDKNVPQGLYNKYMVNARNMGYKGPDPVDWSTGSPMPHAEWGGKDAKADVVEYLRRKSQRQFAPR